MIQLTGNYTLYPPWDPGYPSFFGWRTIVCLVVLLFICYVARQRNKKKQEIVDNEIVYTKEDRIRDLHKITNGIFTPDQKARAILVHLFAYLGIQIHEDVLPTFTIEEIRSIPEAEPILPYFIDLYTLIFDGKKITHQTIKTFTNNLVTSIGT